MYLVGYTPFCLATIFLGDAMDSEKIKKAVEAVISSGARVVDETQGENGYTFGAQVRSVATVTVDSNEAMVSLANILLEQEDIGWVMKSYFCPYAGGGVGVLPIKVANWLVARSLIMDGGIDRAIARLCEFARSNEVEANRVLIVYGVCTEERLEITSDISVVPINELQPSIGFDGLASVLGDVVFHLPLVRSGDGNLPRPALSAIVQKFSMNPVLVSDVSEALSWQKNHDKEFSRLESIAMAMTLAGDFGPQVISRWVEPIGLASVPGLTGGASGELSFMEIVPQANAWVERVDPGLMAGRVKAFLSIDNATRDKIYTPLRRLATAKARRSESDRSIEIGIALEAVFGETNSKTEMAHKTALRCALFVSKHEEREFVFKLIKALYEMRSMVVHGGKNVKSLNVCGVSLEASEINNKAMFFLRCALNKIVDNGGFPNWTYIDLGINPD